MNLSVNRKDDKVFIESNDPNNFYNRCDYHDFTDKINEFLSSNEKTVEPFLTVTEDEIRLSTSLMLLTHLVQIKYYPGI